MISAVLYFLPVSTLRIRLISVRREIQGAPFLGYWSSSWRMQCQRRRQRLRRRPDAADAYATPGDSDGDGSDSDGGDESSHDDDMDDTSAACGDVDAAGAEATPCKRVAMAKTKKPVGGAGRGGRKGRSAWAFC